jgi:hypothetical protein
MARISDTESDEELRGRVQALVFAHLCQRFNEDDAVVALEDLGDRFSAVFPNNLGENMVELFRNSNLVDITENNEFRLTADGIAECRTRHKASAY